MRAVTMTKLQRKNHCSREWICENKEIIKEKGGKSIAHCLKNKKGSKVESKSENRWQLLM